MTTNWSLHVAFKGGPSCPAQQTARPGTPFAAREPLSIFYFTSSISHAYCSFTNAALACFWGAVRSRWAQ